MLRAIGLFLRLLWPPNWVRVYRGILATYAPITIDPNARTISHPRVADAVRTLIEVFLIDDRARNFQSYRMRFPSSQAWPGGEGDWLVVVERPGAHNPYEVAAEYQRLLREHGIPVPPIDADDPYADMLFARRAIREREIRLSRQYGADDSDDSDSDSGVRLALRLVRPPSPEIREAVRTAGRTVVFLDYDARRDPKTDRYCVKCQRDLKGSAYVVRMVYAEPFLVHPDDARESDAYALIGPECIRGLEAFVIDTAPPGVTP